jgi:3,4-dihydroxy 2-butanone 4-phosphate synthase
MDRINAAVSELQKGRFVLVYDADDREAETDFVIASQFVTPGAVRTMRKDGGGLLCVTVHEGVYEKIGLPYLTEINEKAASEFPLLGRLFPNDIPYDAKSAFSITINHRKTFTGITDIDRALTISEFASFCGRAAKLDPERAAREFGMNFRTPGHVALLNASKGLLATRQGHTELTTALVLMAGLAPSATICEMMHDSGRAAPVPEVVKYAKRNDLVLLDGTAILDAWKGSMEKED